MVKDSVTILKNLLNSNLLGEAPSKNLDVFLRGTHTVDEYKKTLEDLLTIARAGLVS